MEDVKRMRETTCVSEHGYWPEQLVARACQLGYLNVPASGNSSEGENVGAGSDCNENWGKRGQEDRWQE